MANYEAIRGVKGVYKYIAFLPYFPTRFKVSEEMQSIREAIWNFKDGTLSKEVAEALANAVDQDFADCTPKDSWCVCVIPASTAVKTQKRFKKFCEEFCKLTKMDNGYHLITNTDDREAKHLEENRNSVNILEYMTFGDFRNKKVILFDDIYTTGESFLKVASKLSQMGAVEVRGLFFGKTHWMNDDGSVNTGYVVTPPSDPDDYDYEPEYDDDIESGGMYDNYTYDDAMYDLLDGQMDAYWNID